MGQMILFEDLVVLVNGFLRQVSGFRVKVRDVWVICLLCPEPMVTTDGIQKFALCPQRFCFVVLL